MQNLPGSSASPLSHTSRRGFLQAGALGALGLSLAPSAKASGTRAEGERSCILIFNVGGPSQLDTFDPKPDAPREIRGPFRPISVRGGGFQISELLPRHAAIGDKFSLVRSVYHEGSALHEAGHQLMQTGRLATSELTMPHIGSSIAYLRGNSSGQSAHVLVPQSSTPAWHAQHAGFLGLEFEPTAIDANAGAQGHTSFQNESCRQAYDLAREPRAVQERYGLNRFGQSCLLARRLVERGAPFVTLNTFPTIYHEATWDIHGSRPFSTVAQMRDVVAPMYDQGYAALIEDLDQRGLLSGTLVAALSEFGRTPRINPAGGRDHWTNCWSVALAGGGVQGGRVVGASDHDGAFPTERPVRAEELVATICLALGVDPTSQLPGPKGALIPLLAPGVQPVLELFA